MENDTKWLILGSVAVLGFLIIFAWFSATQEAKTFNKFTDGPQATTWDALFADLRIDARRTGWKP